MKNHTLVGTYTKAETKFVNAFDRALPVMLERRAVVDVYRPDDGWFFTWLGWRDKEVVTWGEWEERFVDWSAA